MKGKKYNFILKSHISCNLSLTISHKIQIKLQTDKFLFNLLIKGQFAIAEIQVFALLKKAWFACMVVLVTYPASITAENNLIRKNLTF